MARRVRQLRDAPLLALTMTIFLVVSACAGPTTSGASASGSLAPSGSSSSAGSGTIKVGLDVPYSGPDQFEGQQYFQAATMFFDALNAQGGIAGHKVEYVLGDNQCDPAVGVQAVRKLITEDKVNVLIGSGCSSVSLAVMPLLQQYKVPEIDATATNAKISEGSGVGGNIWKFRLNLDDSLMDSVFGSTVIAPAAKRVAIFAVNTDYGRGAVGFFQPAITNAGSAVVDVEYYAQGQSDFRALLTKVKGDNADGILLVSDYPDAGQIMLQAHELAMNVKWFGRGTVVSEDLPSVVKDCNLVNGLLGANFWAPNSGTDELAKLYKSKYNQPISPTVVLSYYAMKLVADAIAAAGGKYDSASIQHGLTTLNENLSGLGQVKFDDHNQAHYPMYITQFKGCNLVTLKTVDT